VNNPIRFLLGWFIISPVVFPPILVLLASWAVGAMIMTGKRYDELVVLGKKLVPYRKSFGFYTKSILRYMMVFYLVLTITSSFVFLAIYKSQYAVFAIAPSVFFVWVVKKILSGDAKARTIENFMLTKEFLLYATLSLIPFLYFAFK
jgi:hypothetical protein